MDISVLAVVLGLATGEVTPAEVEAGVVEDPILLDDGSVAPATAPIGIKPPKWWKGNQAAFDSTVIAQQQMGGAIGSFSEGGGGP